MQLLELANPVVVVISRAEVEAGDPSRALSILKQLAETPEEARRFVERVDIAFHGYDDDSRELFEIEEVRDFARQLDGAFPFWLFFLSKSSLGLQCLLYCMLPPHLTEAGRAKIFPERIDQLLSTRWFPAMNHVCGYVGFSESQIEVLTDRAIDYITNGRIIADGQRA